MVDRKVSEPAAMSKPSHMDEAIRLAIAAADPKGGGVDHGARFYLQDTCHHSPEVYGGIGEIESSVILREFFAEKRQKEHINKGKP